LEDFLKSRAATATDSLRGDVPFSTGVDSPLLMLSRDPPVQYGTSTGDAAEEVCRKGDYPVMAEASVSLVGAAAVRW
jgi:hypothetical protein